MHAVIPGYIHICTNLPHIACLVLMKSTNGTISGIQNFYAALYLSQYIISGACSHFHFLLSVRQSGFANCTAQYTCIKDLKQCGGIDRYIPRDLCRACTCADHSGSHDFSFYLHETRRSSLSSSFSCRTLCHSV